MIPCGDAALVTRNAGLDWVVAAVGAGMFLDAAVDAQGQFLAVGNRIHRCEGGRSDFELVLGGDFSRVIMGSEATLWGLDRGLLLSVDRGGRWFRQTLPDAPAELRRIAALGDYDLWLQFDGETGSRAYRTRDRGNTYVPIDPTGQLHGIFCWSIVDSLHAWAASRDAVLRSTDGGLHWSVSVQTFDQTQAFTAADSLRALARTANGVIYTTDGGRTWVTGPTPPADPFRAVGFAPDGGWVAAGSGVYRASPTDPWSLSASVAAADTLRAVSLAPDGTGWAAGTSGMLLETDDAGRTWEPYRLNLELNAIDRTFVQMSFLETGAGIMGAGTKLLHFVPDRSGPIFRIGVSANPFLPRHIDIHITARERLRNDSLRVAVDDVDLSATLFDPEGYLYRARYEIPPDPGEQLLTVTGRDWGGNVRSDVRTLLGVVLDRDGGGSARWNSTPIRFEGAPAGTVLLLGAGDELGAGAEEFAIIGTPFVVTVDTPIQMRPLSDRTTLVRWDGTGWTAAGDDPVPAGSSEIRALIARSTSVPNEDPLRIYPMPIRGSCTIAWDGQASGPLRWELFDLGGRKVGAGEAPSTATQSFTWKPADPSGRAIASGIYWLRIRDALGETVRKILIER